MKHKGFTLIELLVSVGIFTIVMVIALGALLAVAESDRKAQTLKTITNNLGFALESMARTIRTGVDYSCNTWSTSPPQDCQSGGTLITFKDINGVRVGYQRATSASQCGQDSEMGVGCIVRSINQGAGAPITAPEVVVEDLKFYVVGSLRAPVSGVCSPPPSGTDCMQPRVTITAVGYVQAPGLQKSEFKIQTTVTQRLYDQ